MASRPKTRTEDLILPAVAAGLLGVTAGTLARWGELGILTVWRTPGGHRRYRREEVDRLRLAPPTEVVA